MTSCHRSLLAAQPQRAAGGVERAEAHVAHVGEVDCGATRHMTGGRRVHRQQHADLVARLAAFCRLLCGAFSCSAKVCYVPVVMRPQPRSMALPGNELQLNETQLDARPLEVRHVYLVSSVELEHGVEKQTSLLLDARAPQAWNAVDVRLAVGQQDAPAAKRCVVATEHVGIAESGWPPQHRL